MIYPFKKIKAKQITSVGVVNNYFSSKGYGIIIESNTKKQFKISNHFSPLLFIGDTVKFSYSNNYANNIVITQSFQDLNKINSVLIKKLIDTNEYMAVAQMRQPHVLDKRGYSVSTFSHGFKLSQFFKQTTDKNAQILVLESICGLLKNHMNTQLRNSSDTENPVPRNYLLDNTDLISVVNYIDSIYKNKQHLLLIHRANHYLTKNIKRISIFDYINPHNQLGIIISSTNKSDLISLSVTLKISITDNQGIYMLYIDRLYKDYVITFLKKNIDNIVDDVNALTFLMGL